MTTIDKLDLSVYNMYAMRTRMIEQINQQYRLDLDVTIPPQTMLVDNYPRLTELDILLGILPLHTPWAFFLPPSQYRYLRRSSFAFHRIVPSLGSYEEQEEKEKELEEIECTSEDQKKEKKAIKACFQQIQQINRWLGFIIGRVGQFLQG